MRRPRSGLRSRLPSAGKAGRHSFRKRLLVEDYQPIILAAGATILAIVVVAIIFRVVRRRRRARALQAPLPLIPFARGVAGTVSPPRPGGLHAPRSERFDEPPTATTSEWAAPPRPAESGARGRAPGFAPPSGAADAPQRDPGPSAGTLTDFGNPADMVGGAAVDGASMRFWRPADGTLQFLPGRLEVVAGRDSGQEIRFVRTPGPDGTRVTFGRAEGAPYRHVQLREPTVSRTHARMVLEVPGAAAAGGAAPNGTSASDAAGVPRWRLENLSATNPVVVNGRPLAADGGPTCSVRLSEGDRIEMGEVIFRFHER